MTLVRRLNPEKHGKCMLFTTENFVVPRTFQKSKVDRCKTIILSVPLYGCKTWSLTLREEYRFRVFENKVLKNIYLGLRDKKLQEKVT